MNESQKRGIKRQAELVKELSNLATINYPDDVPTLTNPMEVVVTCQVWGYTRGLDKAIYDRAGLRYNCATEVQEEVEATVALTRFYARGYEPDAGLCIEQENAIVDAICDALVFVLVDTIKLEYYEGFDEFCSPTDANVLDVTSRLWYDDEDYRAYYDATERKLEALSFGNFDIVKCMTECLRHISLRKGSYSEAEKKWIKEAPSVNDLSYDPDYQSCKRDN